MPIDSDNFCRFARRGLSPPKTFAEKMRCRYGVDVSSAMALAQTLGQQNGTYITFGNGSITAPSENNLTPSNSATAATGGGASGGANSPAAGAGGVGMKTNLVWPVVIGGGFLLTAAILVALIVRK